MNSAENNNKKLDEASVFKKIHPQSYYSQFLREEVRPDGRQLAQYRNVQISGKVLSQCDSSCMVKFGKTTCVVGKITSEVSNTSNENKLLISVKLPSLCSAFFSSLSFVEREKYQQQYTYFVNRIVQQCVDLETDSQFQILDEEGNTPTPKITWSLYMNLVVLDHDGNIEDCLLICALKLMQSLQLPFIYFDSKESQVKLVPSKENMLWQPKKIISHLAFGFTFAQMIAETDEETNEHKYVIVYDPSSEEEQLAVNKGIIVVSTTDGSILHFEQTNSAHISETDEKQLMEVAKHRSKAIQLAHF